MQHPPERPRCARAAHRARGDQPEPARAGAAHRCAAGGPAHAARRVEELQNEQRGLRKTAARNLYADLEKRLAALETRRRRRGAAAGGVGAGRPRPAAASRPRTTPAFDALKGGNYDRRDRRRSSEFVDHLSRRARWPTTRSTGSARAYYVKRRLREAPSAPSNACRRLAGFAQGARRLLKLGYTQTELKRTAEARDTLDEVVTQDIRTPTPRNSPPSASSACGR